MKMNLIVTNDVSKENHGFNVDANEVYIVDPKCDVLHIALTSNREISGRLLDTIRDRIKV